MLFEALCHPFPVSLAYHSVLMRASHYISSAGPLHPYLPYRGTLAAQNVTHFFMRLCRNHLRRVVVDWVDPCKPQNHSGKINKTLRVATNYFLWYNLLIVKPQ